MWGQALRVLGTGPIEVLRVLGTDPIEVSYRLEVSSPGIERTLSRPEHFEACMGEKVEVKPKRMPFFKAGRSMSSVTSASLNHISKWESTK